MSKNKFGFKFKTVADGEKSHETDSFPRVEYCAA
jgi:hypothetical protein